MVINPFKAFLFIASGAAAAVATAYVSGALDPYLSGQKIAAVAALREPASPTGPLSPKGERLPQPAPGDPAKAPAAAEPAPETPSPTPEAAPPAVIAPSFDLVRAEPDGSIVIAGKAAPHATVEIVAGAQVIGKTKAGADGDFAVVLDEPLTPGGHELVLRSTTEDKVVATSPETAVVSIPEQKDGQVLALVEKPGEPSKLITVPKPAAPKPAPAEKAPAAANAPPAAEQPADSEQPATALTETPPAGGENAAVATPEQPATGKSEPATAGENIAAAERAPQPAGTDAGPKVAVDAVEIEGRQVFVAGVGDPGRRVRVYANDILLGEALASPGGRFLIETERDLPVGDYIIRADALEPDGDKVVARAAVPFEREAGEAIAAVAPQAPTPRTDPAAEPAQSGKASEPGATPPRTGDRQPAPSAIAKPGTPAERPPASQPAGQGADSSRPNAAAGPAPAHEVEPGAVAPKLQSADGAVIIRRGDTLWRISRRVYGRGIRYSTIYLANQDQINDPDRIWPGQVFNVPEKTPEGEAADMTGVKNQSAPPLPKAPL
jgi:nucleoid-associated protein YgaU